MLFYLPCPSAVKAPMFTCIANYGKYLTLLLDTEATSLKGQGAWMDLR